MGALHKRRQSIDVARDLQRGGTAPSKRWLCSFGITVQRRTFCVPE